MIGRRFGQLSIILMLALMPSCSSALKTPLSQAPDFTLPSLAGGTVTLSEVNKENPVLLVFWASWCPSCVDEVPDLKEIQSKFSERGLKILAVNVEESQKTVAEFQKKHGISYPILLDTKGDVAELYGLVGLPVAILIEKGGRVLYFGFSLPSKLEAAFQPNMKGTV